MWLFSPLVPLALFFSSFTPKHVVKRKMHVSINRLNTNKEQHILHKCTQWHLTLGSATSAQSAKKHKLKFLLVMQVGGKKSLKPCRSLSLCNQIKAPTTLHRLLAHRKMTSLCTANGSGCFQKCPEKTKSMSVQFLLNQFAKQQYIFYTYFLQPSCINAFLQNLWHSGFWDSKPPTVVVAPQ